MTDASARRSTPQARFAPRAVDVDWRPDGTILMRSPIPLNGCERHICAYLERWARDASDRTFLAERGPDRAWRWLSYGHAWRRSRAIGQDLLNHGLGPARPLAILSGNSIEHALMTFGAMLAGVPVAPISPAYCASVGGLARLAEISEVLRPAMVFAQDAAALSGARALPRLVDLPWVSATPAPGTLPFDKVGAARDFGAVDRAYAEADGATVAKILFTSGSTGAPKGVPNTQRMLCSSIRGAGLLFPLDAPPVAVDWMPWHHTMGGNSTLHGMLRDGGTLYIDDGRPLPGMFDRTLRNLAEISTTLFQNVPAGFQMLVPELERNDALRRRFFDRLERVVFGGASLAPETFHRLQVAAVRETGSAIPVIAGYGTTETAPGISATHWPSEGKGELGLPGPGCELKLVPFGDRFELRVRGPNVFTGYLERPDLTNEAFDEEGFYRVGDAVQFMDPTDPSWGLRFAGRLSENFKLSNGTWVLTGEVRAAVLAAAPSIAELVVAGNDRDDLRAIVWPTAAVAECKKADGARNRIHRELAAYNATAASATRRIAAFVIADAPPSMAAGEITDKGYVNQRAVIANRAAMVAALYDGAETVVRCHV